MQQQMTGMKRVVFIQNVELPSRIRCWEQYVREQKSWIKLQILVRNFWKDIEIETADIDLSFRKRKTSLLLKMSVL